MLEIERYDPKECAFPSPAVRVVPQLTLGGLARRAPAGPAPPGQVIRHFARGRYALHEAYRLAGVGPAGALLAPAYHCRTLLDPAVSLGATVLLYPLHADLSPDMEGLGAALGRAQERVAALVATHYFGFAQALAPLAAWCREHDIELIEDCAHGFVLDPADGHPGPARPAMGQTGRFGIASPYKFLPCPDGGLLWAPAELAGKLTAQRRQPWRQQWQSLRAASRAATGRRLEAGALQTEQGPCGRTVHEWSNLPSDQYRAAMQGASRSWASGWVARHSKVEEAASARRLRYQRWYEASRSFRGASPLRAPDPLSTPYMFPLLLDEPEPAFSRLKRSGVPIWRWDDMVVSRCATANRYRQRLLHLPCHQTLSDDELDWMMKRVATVLEGCR